MTHPTPRVWEYSPSDHKADRARNTAQQLEQRLDRALVTIEAMWTLLKDRFGLTDEELVDRVVELDLTDGILDGRLRRAALECASCRRRISRRFPRCMYCGESVRHDPFS